MRIRDWSSVVCSSDLGSYSLPAGTLVSSGDTILVSQHNPAMQDIASALGKSLDRDGTGGMRSPLDMGGFPIINAAPGSYPTDLATVEQAASNGAPIDHRDAGKRAGNPTQTKSGARDRGRLNRFTTCHHQGWHPSHESRSQSHHREKADPQAKSRPQPPVGKDVSQQVQSLHICELRVFFVERSIGEMAPFPSR